MKNEINKINTALSVAFLISVMFSLIGCSSDALDEHLYSSVPVSGFYHNKSEANLALNAVYNGLWADMYRDGQWVTLSDVTGGTLQGGGDPNGSGDRSSDNTVWNTYSWTSDVREVASNWEQNYDPINEANTLLDKLPDSKMSDSDKDWFAGQSKFLRAFYYFNLVRLYGGVPLQVTGTSDLSDIKKPRSSVDEVYTQIISDLKDAETLLKPYSDADHAAGRATSVAATALLAKVYLQQKDWANAAEKAKEVMDMGVFGLFDDYNAVFNPDNVNSKEDIFSVQHGGTSNENASIFYTRMIYLFGPPAQTLQNGNTALFHNLQDVVIFQVPRIFFDSTPDTYRKWQTMRDKMPYYFLGGSLVQDTVSLYAPFVVKYNYVDLGTGNMRGGVDFPLIRYSDMLLTYAEAVNEDKGGPTPEAYDAINKVRQRARAVGTANEQPESVYPDLAGLTQAQFRDSVLAEEAREFVGEGHRRWDLLRHDMLIGDAKARGISNADDHDKVFPLPGNVLSVNENLDQNAGY